MATYTFDIPPDVIDTTLSLFCPKELAHYLFHHHKAYVKDLQWELETLELDNLYEGFDTYEEFADSQGQYALPF